jgi:hypothetical protein
VAGLVSGLERKNSWWIAEHAGETGSDGMQWLLRKACFDIDAIRDDLAGYVAERLGGDYGRLDRRRDRFRQEGSGLSRIRSAVLSRDARRRGADAAHRRAGDAQPWHVGATRDPVPAWCPTRR